MEPLAAFQYPSIRFLFTDIDGTMTENTKISAATYSALWSLAKHQIQVIPVTGRPAGWCDLIVRHWPVHGIIGENGALAYRLDGSRLIRHEALGKIERKECRKKMKKLAAEVLRRFPDTRLAADQFSRRFDVAIDFAEDVPPLSLQIAHQIQNFFTAAGAHAKVSNIHVNAWFGDFDKATMVDWYAKNWLKISGRELLDHAAFVGDSLNDEPMFKKFRHSFAVANVKPFLRAMKSKPQFLIDRAEGSGFVQLAEHLIHLRQK